MNKKRRASVSEALFLLKKSLDIIRDTCLSEEDAMENIPENLQSSDAYSESENAVSCMESAEDHISDAISDLEEIC